MVKVKVGSYEFYMDGYLKGNLDTAKKVIKKDWDMVMLYDGYEGSGKSVKAMQDCKYLDPSFDIDRVCFNPREFTKGINKAKKYHAVLYDEAFTGLTARAAMSIINRTLVKMLAEIRQKNLFVGIVMPTFFDLDKYVALWRSRVLIHVYTKESFQRGYFSFFNMEKKKWLYVLGRKYYNYSKPLPNFRGKFTNAYMLDKEEYKKRKRDSLMKRGEDQEKKLMEEEVKKVMFERMVDIEGMTHIQKAKILGISEPNYHYKLKNYKETGEV